MLFSSWNVVFCLSSVDDFSSSVIKCEICGDAGHIARDCPNRHDKRRIAEYKRMNDEYMDFMEDLGAGRVLAGSSCR